MKILKFSAEYPCGMKVIPYAEVRGRGLRKRVPMLMER